MLRNYLVVLAALSSIIWISGCSMGEEIRRIEEVNRQQAANKESRSTNLTGEQLFIRSCNTCHPAGKIGMGPTLIAVDEHFSTDESLKKMIRAGKGIMPAQPKSTINDQELDHLVVYLRQLNKTLKEDEAKK